MGWRCGGRNGGGGLAAASAVSDERDAERRSRQYRPAFDRPVATRQPADAHQRLPRQPSPSPHGLAVRCDPPTACLAWPSGRNAEADPGMPATYLFMQCSRADRVRDADAVPNVDFVNVTWKGWPYVAV
eukprot:2813245-Rhodomonas_salina.1